MSENTFVYETEKAAYQGKTTKTGNSIAWKIGEWGGDYTNGAQAVNVFTSVKTHALRAGAYALASNTPYTRQDGSRSYPQAFLASMIERKMALVSRDSEYQVWAIPGLAVRAEGFENFLSLDDKVMVGHKVGKRGAAFLLADRVAKALTKSVFINVPKASEDVPVVTDQDESDEPDLSIDIPL
jgi:hypothetical protein